MATVLEDKERNIIPRWRDFRTTVTLGELEPAGLPRVSPIKTDFLRAKLADWKRHRSVSFAADAVGSALVLRRGEEAIDAAKFLLSENSTAPRLAKELAEQIVALRTGSTRLLNQELLDTSFPSIKKESRRRIRQLRDCLRQEPRNPIVLADLAREYTILGLKNQSKHFMELAVKLGPENRFILRSAARLFVHQEDPEHAQHVLRTAEAIRHDPWLLAAEIAVSSAAHKSSNYVKRGLGILEDHNYSLFSTTELASAIATIEMVNASSKSARKLFRRALVDPTENSIAQAEWASRNLMVDFAVTPNQVPPRVYEANAWEYFQNGNWDDSLRSSIKWLYDQPFSVRPVLLGGFITSTILEDFEQSERILKFGLIANKDDYTVLNNLAFVLASANKVEEARTFFDRINKIELPEGWDITVTATEGLLRFREGFPEEGRRLYLTAIEKARLPRFRHLSAKAAIYLAREELLAGSPKAKEAIDLARTETQNRKEKELLFLLERLNRSVTDPDTLNVSLLRP
jgi:tetratricopeptide (TPR) repeat protein